MAGAELRQIQWAGKFPDHYERQFDLKKNEGPHFQNE